MSTHKKHHKRKASARRSDSSTEQNDRRLDGRSYREKLVEYSMNPEECSLEYITGRQDAMKGVAVVKKSDVRLPIYRSKWTRSNNGGLMAAIRVGGRVVFASSGSPKPANDGRDYSFLVIGDNEKRTVCFAHILLPGAAPVIEKTSSGKFVCKNRRPIKTFFHKAEAGTTEMFPEDRHASKNDRFVPADWYRPDEDELAEMRAAEAEAEEEKPEFDEEFESFDHFLPPFVPCASRKSYRLSWASVCMPTRPPRLPFVEF